MTTPKKASAIAPSLTINDDGTVSVNIPFTDEDGLAITTLTAYPSQIAIPTVASSDQTPGPSAFVYTPATPPVLSTSITGAFVVGSIAVVQPIVLPPAQNVDFTVTIASGLVGQTSPISEDAGTLSIVADSSQVAGFAPVLSNP